jgi:hypothetical protein
MGIALCEITHLFTEFNRVPIFKMTEFAQFQFIHHRCVGPEQPYAFKPIPGFKCRFHFERVGAVESVKLGSSFGTLDVGFFNRFS